MKEEKLLKLAEFGDNPEITQFETILDIKEEVEELESKIDDKIAESTNKICEDIYNIPQSKDYTDKLETILAKLDEPDEITVELNII